MSFASINAHKRTVYTGRVGGGVLHVGSKVNTCEQEWVDTRGERRRRSLELRSDVCLSPSGGSSGFAGRSESRLRQATKTNGQNASRAQSI